MERNGLDEECVKLGKVINTLPKGYPNLQDKDKDKETDTEKEVSSKQVTSAAETIYSLYPRKEARGDALRAINNALKVKTADELSEAVNAYSLAVAKWPEYEKRFIPLPATWFNRERYADDRATWSRHATGFAQQSFTPSARIGKDVL